AKPLFSLGNLVATPAALAALERTGEDARSFIRRHITGDWGDLSQTDKQENDCAIDIPLRILSAYTLKDQTKIWVITEADRSSSTILLPEDY
ncbi:MAG: hypothetical protein ACREO5_00305, partial [Candidatus Binatia bacterium]